MNEHDIEESYIWGLAELNESNNINNNKLRSLIISLIKNNTINYLEKWVNENETKIKNFCALYDYNFILIDAINHDIPIEKIEYLLNCGQYKTINYVFNENESPLLCAIKLRNFKMADYLIEYGANLDFDTNSSTILNNDCLYDTETSKYLLMKNIPMSSYLYDKLIIFLLYNPKNNIFLRNIFRSYNHQFILNLLSIYKSKRSLTRQQFHQTLDHQKNKLCFDQSLYRAAFCSKNYEALDILYRNDTRKIDVILNDLIHIINFQMNSTQKTNALNHMNDKLKTQLKNKMKENNILKERNRTLFKYIRNSRLKKLKQYIEKNNIQLKEFNKKYIKNKNKDILKYAIDHDSSIGILNYLFEQCHSTDLNTNTSLYMNKKYSSLLYSTISDNKYITFNFLQNRIPDIKSSINLLTPLYNNNLLTDKNLKCLLNKNFKISSHIIIQLIMDHKNEILKMIFHHYYYNDDFILNLLLFFKNKTPLSSHQLENIVLAETHKITINSLMYEKALSCKNYNAITLLYNNDKRPKDIALSELFKLVYTGYKNDKYDDISTLLNSIGNSELTLELEKFLKYGISDMEMKQNKLRELVKQDNFGELKKIITEYSILMPYLNNDHFDLLIYAIEHASSLEIIKYIITLYKSLNYTFYYNGLSISPLFYAISCDKFVIADILLKNGANINYSIRNTNIIENILMNSDHGNLIHSKSLNYLIKNGYSLSENFPLIMIKAQRLDLLKLYLTHRSHLSDQYFVLKLLSYYKNKTMISRSQLNSLISKEKEKTTINYEWYKEAIKYNNYQALTLFFGYMSIHQKQFLSRHEIYRLLDTVFDICYHSNQNEPHQHHYNKDGDKFLELLFNDKGFNFESFKIEDYLIPERVNKENVGFIEEFIRKAWSHSKFEFSNKKINFEGILKNLCEINNFHLIKVFLNASFRNDSFSFQEISFENVLSVIRHSNKSYLMKLFIKKSFQHPTFNLEKINLKKVILDMKRMNYSHSLFVCLINEIINYGKLDLRHLPLQNILLILGRIEKSNRKQFEDIIDKLISHPTFEFTNSTIKTILLSLCRMKTISSLTYITETISGHEKYNKESIHIKPKDYEKIISTACHYNNNFIIKYTIENYLDNENIHDINFEEIILQQYQSKSRSFKSLVRTLYPAANNKYFNSSSIKPLEKVLLQANRNNDIDNMTFIIKILLDIPSINITNPGHQINLSKIKKMDIQCFSLLINTLIRLHKLNLIKYLISHDDLTKIINMNIKDRNNDYPLMVAFETIKTYPKNIKIFDYLIDHGGAKYQFLNNNKIQSLVLLGLKERNYSVLQSLFKRNINIKLEIGRPTDSLLNAIYQNNIEKVKMILRRQKKPKKINIEYYTSNNYFTPLTFSYLLNHRKIFHTLLNYSNVNELDGFGFNILHYAILREDTKTIKNLIKYEMDNNFKTNKYFYGNVTTDVSIPIKNKEIYTYLKNNIKYLNKLINYNKQ